MCFLLKKLQLLYINTVLGHLNIKRDVLADRRQEKYISIEFEWGKTFFFRFSGPVSDFRIDPMKTGFS
jgi:hypothetical protein